MAPSAWRQLAYKPDLRTLDIIRTNMEHLLTLCCAAARELVPSEGPSCCPKGWMHWEPMSFLALKSRTPVLFVQLVDVGRSL
jgi:hypothetical protein